MSRATNLAGSLTRFSSTRIGVLGDLMVDRFVYGTASRISPEAPVPVVSVERRVSQPGGAANVAHNVLSLGGRLRLFGVLGADEAGRDVLSQLTVHGAGLAGVVQLPDRPSTVKTRIVAQSQHIVRFDEEVASPLPGTAVEELFRLLQAALPDLDLLVISDYAKGVIGPTFAARVIAACSAAGVRVVVDPKPVNALCFAGADVVKPNLGEALRMAGWESAENDAGMAQLCEIISARTGIPQVVITAGARGMYLLTDGGLQHLQGVAQEVYDVAGAGDSVLAALALGLASGLGLLDAARLGNLAGSIAVGHLGVAAVTQSELRARLEDDFDAVES